MRGVKRTGIVMAVVVFCSIALATPTHAADTAETYDPSTTKKDSDVIISRHSFQSDGLHYMQLFNNGSSLQSLEGWNIVYRFHHADEIGTPTRKIEIPLWGMLKPYDYLLISGVDPSGKQYVDQADVVFDLIPSLSAVVGESIELVPSDDSGMMSAKVDLTPPKKTGVWRRNLSSTSNNTYTSTYKEYDAEDEEYKNLVLYGHGLYDVPHDPGLLVSAVVARALNCAPNDTSLGCRDYIKFYNPTSTKVDLSNFMLHYGSSTTDHKVEIAGLIQPKQYHVVDKNSAGDPISLTNSGGFIWLSDKYNITTYDKSIFEYPSMSSSSTIGYAWAQKSGNTYAWTNFLTTGMNTFPHASDPVATPGATSHLKPCAANQYRSTETNRCRLKNSSSSNLVPCKPGQYRSTETNRCRSSTTASKNLKPCAPNQYRSPETNRCRLKGTQIDDLKPCAPGKERNPETNRCRTVHTDIPKAGYKVEEVGQSGSDFVGWWAFAGVSALAVGYGVWEWRREIGGLFGKLFSGHK